MFRVDPARSLVVIEVRRGGSFAQFGHDHIVASHNVIGNVAPDAGRADLYVPLGELVVDEPEIRANAGFEPQPDPIDIAGTRRNMLEKVLDTRRYPFALIAVNDISAGGSAGQLRVAITLRGVTRFVDATAELDKTAEEVTATGTFAIDQTLFGMAPFSLLGGAISVQDRLNIHFRIRARRME